MHSALVSWEKCCGRSWYLVYKKQDWYHMEGYLCCVMWCAVASLQIIDSQSYFQVNCEAAARLVAASPGLLVGFPCYAPQSLCCWYEKYGVGICPPGLLLLLPMERVWALLWKDAPVLRGCLCQQDGNALSRQESKGSASGCCKGLQAGSALPPKTGLTALGIMK